MTTKPLDLLKMVLVASAIVTAIHFTDNYLYFDQYPQPTWITPPGVPRAWLIWTAFAVAGYWLYKNQRFWPAYFCLLIYSTCGLSSLGHYFYGHMHQFTPKMHLLILADGLVGAAVLGFVIWSAWIQKEPLHNSRSPM